MALINKKIIKKFTHENNLMSPGLDLYSILIHPEESATQDLEQTNPKKKSQKLCKGKLN